MAFLDQTFEADAMPVSEKSYEPLPAGWYTASITAAELKNTKIHAGAKAHHVGYLGDTEIGAKANIGAGTIVCNYDGVMKHKTKIGAGAFIGSNSTLVAPVEIGDDSYVAAGSVITHEVPSDALAFGRAHQTLKHGWVSNRRAKHPKK